MYKLNYLFSENQIFDRKHADQQKFEMTFMDEMPLFVFTIQKAFERMCKLRSTIEPSARDRNFNAVLMSGFLKGELLNSCESLVHLDHTGRYYLTKGGEWILYFKKLNSRSYLPDNIETKHVRELDQQLALSLEEAAPVIYIGYTVTKSWDYITGFHAVYSKNNEVIWRSSLDNFVKYSISDENPKIVIPDIEISRIDKDIQIRKKSI